MDYYKQQMLLGVAKGLGQAAFMAGGGLAGDTIAKKAADAYNLRKIDKLKKSGASEDELSSEAKRALKRKKAARTALSTSGALAGFVAGSPAVDAATNKVGNIMRIRRIKNMRRNQQS